MSISQQKNIQKQLKERFEKMTPEALVQKAMELQNENKRLKNRLSDFQPFKQKVIKDPNQAKINSLFQQFKTQKYALKICYLGFTYDGMAIQIQTNNTIQFYLFRAMHTLSLIPTLMPGDMYTRAGRTDKGVSAFGNVVSLRLRTTQKINPQCTKHQRIKQVNYCQMLNAILPEDIRVLAVLPVQDQFNARYWCKSRSYKYFFVKNNLDIQKITRVIKDLEGTHNFVNFCKMNLCNTVNFQRTIFKADIFRVDDSNCLQKEDDRNVVYYFHFVGNSFLWHQIRFMVSILFMIGQGTQPETIIKDLFDTEKYPCKPNYSMAPQYPLILQDCQYDNLEFKPESQTIYKFYNTFQQMVARKCIQKTLIINCMMMARKQLIKSAQITNEIFIKGMIEKFHHGCKSKRRSVQLHKASGRKMEDVIQSLKGKRKQLYEKKAQKQAQYDAKVKQQQNKKRQQNEASQQQQSLLQENQKKINQKAPQLQEES